MTGTAHILRDVLVPTSISGFSDFGNSDCLRGDLIIAGGRVVELRSAPPTDNPRMVLPALVEAHCHLDKCHTIDRMQGIGGDLAAAIEAQWADKAHWTEEDLRQRCARGLDELQNAGVGLARSHVDWGDGTEPPLAWHILNDLATDRRDRIELTLSPLVNVDLLAQARTAETIARTVAQKGTALGTFVLNQPDRETAIRNAFALADKFGLMLDFHVDEDLGADLNNVELIADVALETGFQGPVLCGHACALISKSGPELDRVIDKIARAGLYIAALPTTNLYLQGRTSGTPDRRGLTRLRELHETGVSIVVGSDNVADAFCPLGQHDPMAALHLAVLGAHLDPPLDRWLPAITTNAAKALGRPALTIAGARIEDLRISPARSLSELVAGRAGPLRSIDTTLEIAPS